MASPPCDGHHSIHEGIAYCVKLPARLLLPPKEGDTVLATVRRWLNSDTSGYGCTVGFDFEDLTREEVPTTSNLHSIRAGQLMLLFDLPGGMPPAGKTQIFKLEVSRTQLARFKDAPAFAERLRRNAELCRRHDSKTDSKQNKEDGNAGLVNKAAEPDFEKPEIEKPHGKIPQVMKSQITLTPVLEKTRSGQAKGLRAVKIGDTPVELVNKSLFTLLKGTQLDAQLPSGYHNAYERLQAGHAVVVKWQQPSWDPLEIPLDTEWYRLVPRIDPENVIYIANKDGSLSSRLREADHAKRFKVVEPKTILREAQLYDFQRLDLKYAISNRGWPGRVVNGKIVFDIFGHKIELDQEYLRPGPIKNGIVRLKLRCLDPNLDILKCQPMAASPGASFWMCRYETVLETTKTSPRFYEPFAVQVDAQWSKLLTFCTEALLVETPFHGEDRLVYVHQYESRPEGDLFGGINVRLREGGARLPLKMLGNGWGEYRLPGRPSSYSRRRSGKKKKDPTKGEVVKQISGPELERAKKPHDVILYAGDSNEDDFMDGMSMGIWPRGEPGKLTIQFTKLRPSF